jgi:hypothetical protein
MIDPWGHPDLWLAEEGETKEAAMAKVYRRSMDVFLSVLIA